MNNQFIKTQSFTISNNDTSYKLDKSNIQNIRIFNNISQIGYVVEIIYNDITDVKNKLPLKGGEILSFTIVQENGTKFKKSLLLNKISVISDKDDLTSILKMSFITEESYYLTIKRDYNYYEDTPVNIISNYIPDIEGSSDTSYNIIIPGYNYNKAIQYINTYDDGYVFETLDSYKYSTLDDLLVTSDRTLIFKSNNILNKNLIQGYKEISVFNSLDEGSINIYNRTNTYYNPDDKVIETNNILVEDLQTSTKSLGSGANYSENIKDNINTRYITKNYFEGELESNISDSLFNKNYEIMIRGDLDLEVGDTLNISFRDRFNTNPNPMLAGVWLITKIMHQISRKEFITKIQVSKNAYYSGDVVSNVV